MTLEQNSRVSATFNWEIRMDTLEFLQRVLPGEGFYVITVINDGAAPQQGFFPTVEDLAKACVTSDSRKNNTYYAISSFKSKASRKKENVHLTKVVAVDIDCAPDKPYLTQRDGLIALADFIRRTSLPAPMIVSSGRGIHAYWVFDRALTPLEWTPIALGLKSATVAMGFMVDPVPTANSALVLRPTGTHNPKNGAEVKLLRDAPLCDPQHVLNMLSRISPIEDTASDIPPAVATAAQTVKKHFGHTALLDNLAVTQEYAPALGNIVASRCQQIAKAIEHPEKVEEPLWYAMLGIAAHCVDPEDTAKDWSKGHPGYTEAATLKKLKQYRDNTSGPTTCARFKSLNDKGCDKCTFRGKIVTPAHLSTTYKEAAIDPTAPDPVAFNVPMPTGFKRYTPKHGGNGIVQMIDGTDVVVCDFDIYPVGYGMDESRGYETVRFKWKRRHVGWSDLVFRQAHLAEENREFPNSLADQGIVLNGKNHTGTFQFMLRSYMQKLRELKTVSNFYNTMGWKEGHTRFVVGDRMYTRDLDGTVTHEDISISMASNRLSSSLYTRAGTAKAWTTAMMLLENQKLYPHMFTLLQGFAAPLWGLMSGLNGITISLAGPTGGGKSIAQLMQQSIWGDPTKLHIAAKFTSNMLFNRLGFHANLPMTIDEATVMADKDVSDFCYMVTQGRDKGRMTRNAEEREARTWATVVTVSTNISFASKLVNTGMDTDAQMARLLEIDVPVHPLFKRSSDAGRMVATFLAENHGVVGEMFIMACMRIGADGLRALIKKHAEAFSVKYGVIFTGSERFWEQCLILADVAGAIAKAEGIIAFDYTKSIAYVAKQLDVMRRQISDNHADNFSLLDDFMNEFRSQFIAVMHNDGKAMVDYNQIPRDEIVARLDLYRKSAIEEWSHGVLMVSKTKFRQWISARGYDYATFMREMRAEGVDATPGSKKASFGKDTGLKGIGQTAVIGISCNHPRTQHYLEKYAEGAEDLTFGQMAVVEGSRVAQ